MNVTIIGAGNMGRGIGTRLAAGGHSLVYIDSNPEAAEKTAAEVQPAAQKGASVKAGVMNAENLGEVVILAVWYGTNMEIAKQLGNKLDGKVVVDIANPLNQTFDDLATASGSSSAEDLARVITPGAKVVKAFNTTFAGTLLAGEVEGQSLDVFIAGDDQAAKNKVIGIVKDSGMRPIDAGPLKRARQIEGMQLLHILLQQSLGTNWKSAIKIIG